MGIRLPFDKGIHLKYAIPKLHPEELLLLGNFYDKRNLGEQPLSLLLNGNQRQRQDGQNHDHLLCLLPVAASSPFHPQPQPKLKGNPSSTVCRKQCSSSLLPTEKLGFSIDFYLN